MLETNMDVVRRMQERKNEGAVPFFACENKDWTTDKTELRIDKIMAFLASGSRILAWVAAILTLIFVLAPVWLRIFWP